MTIPLVSVAVPVYNGESHLIDCLGSILSQHYPNLEIIVADGGSSDSSESLLATVVDARLRLLPPVSQPIGLHSNWERVIEACSGEYVKLLCQDDAIDPACLAIQADLLSRHPHAALVANRRSVINQHGQVLFQAIGLGSLINDATSREVPLRDIVRACVRSGTNLLGEPASVMFRRTNLPVPLFGVGWNYPIDLDLYLRSLETGGTAVLDRRVVASFRVAPTQLSVSLAATQATEMRAFFDILARRHTSTLRSTDLLFGKAAVIARALTRRAIYNFRFIERILIVMASRRNQRSDSTARSCLPE